MIKVRVARAHRNVYGEKSEKAFNDTYDVPDGHEVALIAAKLVVLDKGKPLAAPGAKPAKRKPAKRKPAAKKVTVKTTAPKKTPAAANDADVTKG